VKGKKYFNANPLTAFDYFAANTSISDPDDGVYDGTQQWFNLMRGDLPRPQYPAGTPFYTSSGYATDHGIVTSYCLSGDPTAGEGWIDGYDVQAADRRIVSVHGPITLHLHDTAEVVIALIGGIGADNLSSVKVLKYNTTYAQFAFNNLFVLPAPPPNPQVSLSNFDENIVLNWANAKAQEIEASDNSGFKFEGYNVYQLPSPSAAKSTWVRIATYDIKGDNVTVIIAPSLDANSGVIVTAPVQFGSESGIKRTITIDKDYVRQRPLVNSQEYYYAVSAYSYNPDWSDPASPNKAPFPSLESSPIVITAVPHIPDPGVRYPTKPGDTLAVTHVSSGLLSEGKVYPIVVAPDKLTGHVYKVTFQPSGNSTVWSVIDSTDNNTVKLSGQSNTTGDADYLVVDGVQVVVYSPTGFRDFAETANASGPLASPVYASYAFNSNGFPNTEDYPDGDRPPSDEQVSGAYWGICTGATAAQDASYEYFLSRTLRDGGNNAVFSGRDFEIRFTAAGGYAYDAFGNDVIMHVPFEIWNLGYTSAASDDFKMIPLLYDVNLDGVFDLDGEDHPVSGGDNDPETDWIYWYNPTDETPGTAGYDAFAARIAAGDTVGAENLIGDEVMARTTLVGWNLGSVGDTTFPLNIPAAQRLPETGTIIRISSLKPSTPSDEFIYTATAPTYNAETAKADVNLINVFPNPYYGLNARETSRLNKYVTFNHLPPRATIRIFNLAGILVTTIEKDDATSQLAMWNLKNQNNLPVASGIYVAYIDMPDLGKSKVLKLAIVQEEQILPTY
jgi:hypothetical protein